MSLEEIVTSQMFNVVCILIGIACGYSISEVLRNSKQSRSGVKK